MNVRIRFDDREPPAGQLVADHVVHPFVGWLSLLRLLEEVAGADDVSADGGSGTRGAAAARERAVSAGQGWLHEAVTRAREGVVDPPADAAGRRTEQEQRRDARLDDHAATHRQHADPDGGQQAARP